VRLDLLLTPERVFLDIPVHTREEVLVYVAEQLERSGAVKRSLDLVDLLLDRERLGATVVGDETAIPHCRVPGLHEIVVAFARVTEPIPFGERQEPARLFFFVLSPQEQPAAHLQVLANIAHLLRNPEVRRSFESSPDAMALTAELAKPEHQG
jgi:mannitol/fructose-specific phosphotransferase system IIA component (Ntr-type)